MQIPVLSTTSAASGWVDCVERFGSGNVTLGQILAPATKMARDGFPVGTVCASEWQKSGNLVIATTS